jgi:hypothetical protein
MPRPFHHATAEQTVAAVEAVQVNGVTPLSFVEKFCDLSTQQATNALSLAVDLGLLAETGGDYVVSSPLARFVTTPDESGKAAVLRIMLETYDPFIVFRNRLAATGLADTAAQQTKTMLNLTAHREEIKDTLISLGTYTSALRSLGGGRYAVQREEAPNQLLNLAKVCDDVASAEARIRAQVGHAADTVSRQDVLMPLASALMKAASSKGIEAVTEAGKAVESYLAELAGRMGVTLTGASGIIQKFDRFRTGNKLPKKIVEASKYLGQIRNAADHGRDTDPDVNAVWKIQATTALEYVFVACSIIAACNAHEKTGDFLI